MDANAIVKGSLGYMTRQAGRSLAESWINVDAVILVDISGSMSMEDAQGGKSRHEVAQEELEKLQNTLPGKLAIVAFSRSQYFLPNGSLMDPAGTTDMADALRYVRVADAIPGMRFFLISDGDPDDEADALTEARKFKNRIDCIYVGPEDGSGREFLRKLASVCGGEMQIKPLVKELASGICGLLEG